MRLRRARFPGWPGILRAQPVFDNQVVVPGNVAANVAKAASAGVDDGADWLREMSSFVRARSRQGSHSSLFQLASPLVPLELLRKPR